MTGPKSLLEPAILAGMIQMAWPVCSRATLHPLDPDGGYCELIAAGLRYRESWISAALLSTRKPRRP